MSTIVPAILPVSAEDLEDKLSRLVGVAHEVQIDVVDGVFAGPASWPYREEGMALGEDGMLPFAGQFRIEVDLMVQHPEEAVGAWIEAGATRILVHFESTTALPALVQNLQQRYGHDKAFATDLLSLGIALNWDTDPELLAPFLDAIDYVQFMGIRDIGKQGQPFDTTVLNRIAVFHRAHPDMELQIDGGVNFESAPSLIGAGVSRLVVGSALWNAPVLKEAYDSFAALDESHGWFA